MTNVTKSQIKKLDAICGKIEALQNEITDPRTLDLLRRAKREAMDALKAAEAA